MTGMPHFRVFTQCGLRTKLSRHNQGEGQDNVRTTVPPLGLAAGKTTRKVLAPPGGVSNISFGGDNIPISPKPVVLATVLDAGDPAGSDLTVESKDVLPGVPAVAIQSDGDIDSIKLKALALISSISKESVGLKDALSDLVKKLEAFAGEGTNQGACQVTVYIMQDLGGKVWQSYRIIGVLGLMGTPSPAVQADEALAQLNISLKLRGTHGIISLGRKFRSLDDDGDNKLSFDEFKKGLFEMEMSQSEADLHRLFRFFDADCSGYLSFDELLVGLRGALNYRRQTMVGLAFKVLDKDGSGVVTADEFETRYDANRHPDVMLGVKTETEVLLEFMGTFEAQGGGIKGDGNITMEEFSKYYMAISASIDDDDYFELVIRNAWHISGGEGWCANTTCKRVLVLHDDGSQSVQEVKDDFDINTKDVTEVKRVLLAQGVKNIKHVALYGIPAG